MKAMKLVQEEQYEIVVDIHGIRDGPRLGRLRILNKVCLHVSFDPRACACLIFMRTLSVVFSFIYSIILSVKNVMWF